MRTFCFILGLLFAVTVQADDIEGTSVLLRGVDKVTGRTKTTEVTVGEPTTFGNIRITPQRCLKKPPEEMPENAAFLLIEEENRNGAFEVVFNGWMFSSNPALSAMEHPIFDIWVLECLNDTVVPEEWETIVPLDTPQKSVETININKLDDI